MEIIYVWDFGFEGTCKDVATDRTGFRKMVVAIEPVVI